MAESEEALKCLLMKVRENEAGLKLNIQKTKSWHLVPSLTSWQTDGETTETVTDFIFLGSKITADSDCSQEIKVLLWREVMTNLDSVLKSRDITLLINGHMSTSYGFSTSHVWMWELDHKEGWALKNCGAGEDSRESLGLQDRTSQS